MPKLRKIVFIFLISLGCLNHVNALNRCSTSARTELNKLLPGIKVSYAAVEKKYELNDSGYINGEEIDGGPGLEQAELIDGEEDIIENSNELIKNYFDISITNITNQFYVEVSNDIDEEVLTYNYTNTTDNIITFPWEYFDDVTTFTFKIYASETTKCEGNLLKTLTLRIPRINENYDNPVCADIPEFSLCQKFVTFDNMDYDNFLARVNSYKETKYINNNNQNQEEKNMWTKITDFIKENKYYFIGGGVVVLATATGIVIMVIKKRRIAGL